MISKSIKIAVLGSVILFASCKEEPKNENKLMTDNILLQEWEGPYQGVPAFDKMNVSDVKEAVEKGMELQLKEIDAIANNEDEPTFEILSLLWKVLVSHLIVCSLITVL